MKRHYVFHLLCCCFILVLSLNAGAALSGAYTINPAGTASATNYKDFESAISHLRSGTRTDGGPVNGAGVSGPVTFTVSAGTYFTQLTISGIISGSSAINTITFDGVNAATRIVEYEAFSSTSRHTIRLENTRYITLKNLTIRAFGDYGWAVHIQGTGSGNHRISNCVINAAGFGAPSDYAGIVANGSTNGLTTGARIDSLLIDSNKIEFGYYGIALSGSGSLIQAHNKITYNAITSINQAAIQVSFQDGAYINNNLITNPSSQFTMAYGIFVNTMQNSNAASISSNTIRNSSMYAIRVGITSGTGSKSIIGNNMISKAFGSGISMEDCNGWNILNNSVSVGNGYDGPDAALSIIDGSGITVYNNILGVSVKSPLLPLYVYGPGIIDSMDHNVFYRKDLSDQKFIYINNHFGLNNYKGASGFNQHSSSVKPLYLNDSNLRIVNNCLRGVTFPVLTTDIDGTIRSQPFVIGAHEGTSIRNNITVTALSNPVNPLTSTGWYDIAFVVQNTGDTPVYSFKVSYELNSIFPVTQTITDTLNPCDTMTVTFSSGFQGFFDISNTLKVYTSLPNGLNDPYANDDTLISSLFMPLNGNYTIGGANADFATFSAAASVLVQSGVSGPVVFTAAPGTYNEQVSVGADIPGVSSVNTVTFDGISKDSVIILNNVTTSERPFVFHIAADYVTVRNITLKNTSSQHAYGFMMNKNGMHNVKIKSCKVELTNGNTTGNFGGIILCEGTHMENFDNFRVDSIEIDSNIVVNGRIGISHKNSEANQSANSTRIAIRNNVVLNNYFGILVEKVDGLIINYNTASLNQQNGLSAIDVLNSEAPDSTFVLEVIGNRITGSETGINLNTIFNTTTKASLVANNVISGKQRDAIYIYGSENISLIHNSISVTEPTDMFYLGAVTVSYCSHVSVINNQVSISADNTYSPLMHFSSSSTGLIIKNNNFYKKGEFNFMYLDRWITEDEFMSNATLASGSHFVSPDFINDSLQTRNGCMNGTASVITTDIKGNPRSSSPDIGAYEITPFANDIALVSLSTPSFPVTAGSYNVEVKVMNRGDNPVSNMMVSYVLNNGTPVIENWVGFLQPCDTTTIIFTAGSQVTVTPGMAAKLTAYCSFVNGLQDGFSGNDTIEKMIATPLAGTYFVGGSSPDYVTITEAVNDLKLRGVNDAVSFKIRTGTYNEHIEVSDVAGTSAVNTVTFTSEAQHKDSVTIVYAAASTDSNYVLRFTNAHYYHFSHLTLKSTNPALCKVVEYLNPSSYDSISYCKLISPLVTSVLPPDNSVVYAYNFIGTNQVLTRNEIIGGSMGIYIFGLSEQDLTNANVISHNTITQSYQMGISVFYHSNTLIHANNITQGSANTAPQGIQCYYGDSAVRITSNLVRLTAGGHGINAQFCDGTAAKPLLIANNSVIVTGTIASHGIRNQASKYIRVYNNSVNVSTTHSTGYAGYFHYQFINQHHNNDIKNNVFSNTGNGTAMYLYSSANNTVKTDFNNLYATASNLVQRGLPAASYANIYLWRNATFLDLNSVSYRPGFTSASNLQPDVNDSASWSLNGYGVYLDSALLTTDINGNERPKRYAEGTPDLGAYEFTPTAVPPAATANVAAAPNSIQVFMFAADSVCRISWGASVPDQITVRRYSGVIPVTIAANQDYMNFYTGIEATGTYSFDADIHFRENWIGTNPVKANIVMSRKEPLMNWLMALPSSIDVVRNVLTTQNLNTSALYSGTNLNNPMPVKLISFTGVKSAGDVKLGWKTAQEVNNKGFDLQRSIDGVTFKTIAFVKGKQHSERVSEYGYTDSNVPDESKLYYRLAQHDHDGRISLSNVVVIENKTIAGAGLSVYPNPFNKQISVNVTSYSAAVSTIEIFDLTGKKMIARSQLLNEGVNEVIIDETEKLNSGIYFISVSVNGSKQVLKLVKQ